VVLAWVAVACQRSPEVRREDAGTVTAAAAPAEFPWTLAWVRHVGTPRYEAFERLATTPDDGVVLAGNYGPELALGPHTLRALEVSSYNDALYLAKISASGEWQWARSFDGKGASLIATVAVGKDGTIWLGGEFEGTVSGLSLEGTRSRSPFVVRLSPEGIARTQSPFLVEGFDKASITSLAFVGEDVLAAGGILGGFRENGSSIRCKGHTGVLLSRFASDGSLRYAKCLDVVSPFKGIGPLLGVIDGRAALCVSADPGTFPREEGGVRLYPLSPDGALGSPAEGGMEGDECHAVFPLADGLLAAGWITANGTKFGLWRGGGNELHPVAGTEGPATPALRLPDGRFVIAIWEQTQRRYRLVLFSASLVPGPSLALPSGLDPEALALTRSGALIVGAGFSGDIELGGKTYRSIPDPDSGAQLPTDAVLLRFEPRATRPSP
jgi:hypothetical protein